MTWHLSCGRCHTRVVIGFFVQRFETWPEHLHVQLVSCTHDVLMQRLEVEADELASFGRKKANKQWVWIAMDAKTRQIIALHVGDRSHKSAEQLWVKIPQAYRHHATFYTDQYVAYEKVIPAAQHKAISKLAHTTNHIERFTAFRACIQHKVGVGEQDLIKGTVYAP